MTLPAETLVERLERAHRALMRLGDGTCHEAAARIQYLEARLAEACQVITPFAEAATFYPEEDDEMWASGANLRLKNLRAARDFLERKEG